MRQTAVLLLLSAAALAGDPITWKYNGFARLPDAAAEAKKTNRHLLVGLAGSPL